MSAAVQQKLSDELQLEEMKRNLKTGLGWNEKIKVEMAAGSGKISAVVGEAAKMPEAPSLLQSLQNEASTKHPQDGLPDAAVAHSVTE